MIWPCWLLPSLASTELSEESLDPGYAQRWLLVVGRVLGCGRAAGLDTSPVRYVAAAREQVAALGFEPRETSVSAQAPRQSL